MRHMLADWHESSQEYTVVGCVDANFASTTRHPESCRLADSLAAQLGTSPGLPSRGAAALSAELQSVARRSGHCYLPWGQLRNAALAMLMQTGTLRTCCGLQCFSASQNFSNTKNITQNSRLC